MTDLIISSKRKVFLEGLKFGSLFVKGYLGTNPKNAQYHNYGGRGINVSTKFVNDFNSFEVELGPYPGDGEKYTVERINVNLGYIEGNIKWATYQEQSRNRRKSTLNVSGTTGVNRTTNHGRPYWVAYVNTNYKRKNRYFSIDKLGEQVAYEMAVNARNSLLKLAAKEGYTFSDQHGK